MELYLDKTNDEIIISTKESSHLESLGFKKLTPNSVDASTEKHVPVVEVNGSKVTVSVGSVTHPMTAEHLINRIILETNIGYSVKILKDTDKPEAIFNLSDGEEALAVYEYCNLHGLWITKIN